MMFKSFKKIERYIESIREDSPEIHKKLITSSEIYSYLESLETIDSINPLGIEQIREQIGIIKPNKKLSEKENLQNLMKESFDKSIELGIELMYLDFFDKFRPFIDNFIYQNRAKLSKKPDKKFDYHLGIFTNIIALLLPAKNNINNLRDIGFRTDQVMYLLLNQYMAIIELLKNIYADSFNVKLTRVCFYVSSMIKDFEKTSEFSNIKHYFDSNLRNAIGHSNFKVKDGETNPYIEYENKNVKHRLYITMWEVNTGENNVDLKNKDNFYGMIIGIKFFTMMFYFRLRELV